MTKNLSKSIFWTFLIGAILILLKVYIQNHSLFLDEVNLARNIIELNYLDFFKPLRYQQFSSPFFLCLEKLTIDLLGVSDYTLRLLPFLLTIVSLLLFAKIIQEIIQNEWVQLFAILLFSYSSQVVYHAVEVKQYAVDLCITTLLLYVVLILKWRPRSDFSKLCVLGAISIWFSMPSIFVLAGIGLYLFIIQYYTGKTSSLVVILTWIVSFVFFYFLILQPAISNDALISFHSPFYFGRNGNVFEQITGLFTTFLDKTAIPLIGGMILFILGLFYLYTKQKLLLVLLTIPIISMLFASLIGQYSIIPRLILFSIPFWVLILAFGLSLVIGLSRQLLLVKVPLMVVSVLLLITTLINNSSLHYVIHRMVKEEGRSALLEIPYNNKVPIYLSHHAIPTYEYYCKLIDKPIVFSGEIITGEYNPNLLSIKEKLLNQGIDSLWIIDIHTFGEEKKLLDNQINEIGKVEFKIEKKYASVSLILLYST